MITEKLLTSPLLKDVFDLVADRKTMKLGDIATLVEKSVEDLDEPVNVLKAAGLVKTTGSVLPRFSSVFITADGLGEARKLSRLAP